MPSTEVLSLPRTACPPWRRVSWRRKPTAGGFEKSRNTYSVRTTQEVISFPMRRSLVLLSQPISLPISFSLLGLHESGSSIESWRLEICISLPTPAINRITCRRHFDTPRNMLSGGIRLRAGFLQWRTPLPLSSTCSLTSHDLSFSRIPRLKLRKPSRRHDLAQK